MNVLHRITRSRGLVLTMPTTPTMIMTCAVDQAESIHQDMKEYVPDQIPMKEVINFLIRCYMNCLGPPRPGDGEGREKEEEKSVGYLERALSLLRYIE